MHESSYIWFILTVIKPVRLVGALIVRLLMICTKYLIIVCSFQGDITQKGYDKKRYLLLGPYLRIKRDGMVYFFFFFNWKNLCQFL